MLYINHSLTKIFYLKLSNFVLKILKLSVTSHQSILGLAVSVLVQSH